VWKVEKQTSTEVTYRYGSPTEPLEIVKEFTILPEDPGHAPLPGGRPSVVADYPQWTVLREPNRGSCLHSDEMASC
jgi:hypothetical protein